MMRLTQRIRATLPHGKPWLARPNTRKLGSQPLPAAANWSAEGRWWLHLARYSQSHRRGLAGVISLMLLGIGFDLLKPWPMKLIVDQVLQNHRWPAAASWLRSFPGGDSRIALLGWLTAATVVLFLAGQVIRIIRSYVESGLGSRMVYELAGRLFDHLQGLSLQFHGKRSKGDLVRRVTNDSSCVRELVMWVCLPVLSALISLAAMFVVMWKLDPALSLIALLVAVPLGVFIRIFSRPMSERNYQQQQLEGQIMTLSEQTLSALPVVQAFGREDYQDQRFRDLSERTVRASLLAVSSQLQFKVSTTGVTAVGTAVVMLVGALHVLQGRLTVGTLLVFLAYLASLYTPMETLAYVSSGFASAAARARRVLEVLKSRERVQDLPGARNLPHSRGGQGALVSLEGVTFGYEPDRPVLHEVSLEAQPGETLALVGTTGAGKSTLVSLIPRFFDPCRGCLRFNGVDIRDVTLASLRQQVALVLQEPFLLPLSITENIAYGRPGASREEIEAAARAANADAFIERLPQGYDTVLGERGASLSGGERQRLSIARALLKDAPVLILDEPTSALDAATEALLLEALERLMQGRTTFIIAHRLSTIRNADRIVVLDHGRITESGTHRELLNQRGDYCRLHELQTSPAMEAQRRAAHESW